MRLFLAALLVSAPIFAPHQAEAQLRFCNNAADQVSVAIGYARGDDWFSEGWWTMAPGECKTAIGGALPNRYYYYRITSPSITFPTENFTFCTSPRVFDIVGDGNCEGRGYDTSEFLELDLNGAKDWTVNITSDEAGAPGGPGGGGTGGAGGEREQAELDAEYERLVAEVERTLFGAWISADDNDFAVIVDGSKIMDFYQERQSGTANWTLADTCSGANGAGPVMIVTYVDAQNDPLCWVLLELTDRRWSFRAVGATRDVTMVRAP